MGIQVHLDPDVEALLKQQARPRNVDFDRVLNEWFVPAFPRKPRLSGRDSSSRRTT